MLRWLYLLPCLVAHALAQFGNAHVQWDAQANPTVTTPDTVPTRNVKVTADGRKTGLMSLPIATLTEILSGLNVECTECESVGHFVSKVRSTCLGLGPKALKVQLAKRGVKCEGCTQKEHYLDRVLDTVHLWPRT